MVTDYEAAWIALQAYVASKTQHGRDALLPKMAELADVHRVPAGELSRLLRLHGVEVERARSMSAEIRAEAFSSPADELSPTDDDLAGQHDQLGGHDGHADEDAGAGRAGRADDAGRRSGDPAGVR